LQRLVERNGVENLARCDQRASRDNPMPVSRVREREEQEAAAQRRAECAKHASEQERKGSKVQKRQVGGLPDQSGFEVRYDAATEMWSGTLTVPGDGMPRTFTASASGVFKLLSRLDELYRASLSTPAHKQADVTPPSGA
jgi:hypothetical protein